MNTQCSQKKDQITCHGLRGTPQTGCYHTLQPYLHIVFPSHSPVDSASPVPRPAVWWLTCTPRLTALFSSFARLLENHFYEHLLPDPLPHPKTGSLLVSLADFSILKAGNNALHFISDGEETPEAPPLPEGLLVANDCWGRGSKKMSSVV